jgi:hypothetical protein
MFDLLFVTVIEKLHFIIHASKFQLVYYTINSQNYKLGYYMAAPKFKKIV